MLRSSSMPCTSILQAMLTLKLSQDGHYEGVYFSNCDDPGFSLSSPATIRRIRAVVQFKNTGFSEKMRTKGHKYQIDMAGESEYNEVQTASLRELFLPKKVDIRSKKFSPVKLDRTKALAWAREGLIRTRGRELVGNFNPLLIGELFWEQCSNWERLAVHYLDEVWEVCSQFLSLLLDDKCPKDVVSRLRVFLIQDVLKIRYEEALSELGKIMEDTRCYPINYNHYYTDTISAQRQERQKNSLTKSIEAATNDTWNVKQGREIDVAKAVEIYHKRVDPNMESVSCEEALDCLSAIYKVSPPQSILHCFCTCS